MKAITYLITVTLFTVLTQAQRLPNVQHVPLRAPVNIKIDGRSAEWADRSMTKNPATGLTYAISNDDNYLYLIFQADHWEVQDKIFRTGITFLISKDGKRNDKNAIGVAYPTFEKRQRRPLVNWNVNPQRRNLSAKEIDRRLDSIVKVNNHSLATSAKLIAVRGIKGVDTLISVHNDDSIKAAGATDKRKIYTYEMAIALKHLNLSAAKGAKFFYHVILNGGFNNTNAPQGQVYFREGGSPEMQANIQAMAARMMATTDFWGEYTLAPKP